MLPDDLETFPSLRAASEALGDRARFGHWSTQTFTYADGRTEHSLTPCADEGPEMVVYLRDPRDERDPYPDRVITIGPRGGLRIERT